MKARGRVARIGCIGQALLSEWFLAMVTSDLVYKGGLEHIIGIILFYEMGSPRAIPTIHSNEGKSQKLPKCHKK